MTRFRATSQRGYTTAVQLALSGGPWQMVGVAGASVVGGVLPVAVSWSTGQLLDGVSSGRPWSAVASFGTLTLAALMVPRAGELAESELRRRVSVQAQTKLFASINSFPGLAPFENPSQQDRLRIAEQAGMSAPNTVVKGFLSTLRAAVTIVGLMLVLASLDLRVAGLVLFAAVPALAAELVLSSGRARSMLRFTPADRRRMVYGALQTDVRAAKEIRLFGLGDFLLNRMLAEVSHLNREERRLERRDVAYQAGLAAISAAATVAAVALAVQDAVRGAITPGKVVVVVTSFTIAQVLLSSTAREIGRMHQSALLLTVYAELTSCEVGTATEPLRPAPTLRRGVRLRDVWFRYSDEGPWVLKGVDLDIPVGTSVAVVGANGAGKSTLAKLLCGLYAPVRGTIEWDGIPLQEIDLVSLRTHLSAVFQDYMAYDMTAADNIAIGDLRRQSERSAIVSAGQAAGVDAAIAAMPQGYDTPLTRFVDIGEGAGPGTTLSGGQWQRVAIARAVLRGGRDLLVLDEPSSGLDPESERHVHELLLATRAGRASLLISHRLNAVRDADVIAVLEDGVITERGTHEALMCSAASQYGRLFRLQARGYQGDRLQSERVADPNDVPA